MILLFREIGFSLAEIGRFVAGERQSQRELIEHKLAELAAQQHRIEVARSALEHGRHCPASQPCSAPDSGRASKGDSAASPWKSHARAH